MRIDRRILAILVLALLVRAASVYIAPVKWWDETVYAGLGWKLSINPLDYSFGPFWDLNYGCRECAGYRAPLLPYLLAGIYAVFGDNHLAAEMLVPLFGVLGVFGAYLLAREFFGEKTALVTALFMALVPFHLFYSGRILTDVPATTCITFAALFFWKGFVKGEDRYCTLCGIASGISILARYMSVLILPVFLAILLARHRNLSFLDKRAAGACAALLLVLLPLFAYSNAVYGNPLGAFAHGSEAALYWEGGDTLTGFLVWSIVYYSAVSFAAAADIFGALGKKLHAHHMLLVSWIAVFLLFGLAFPHKEARFLLPAAPALAILAAEWAQAGLKRVLAVSTILAVSIALLAMPGISVHDDTSRMGELCFLEANEFIAGSTPEDALILSDYSPVVFYYTHRDTEWPHYSATDGERGTMAYALLSEYDRGNKTGLGHFEVPGGRLVFSCPEAGEPLAQVYRIK